MKSMVTKSSIFFSRQKSRLTIKFQHFVKRCYFHYADTLKAFSCFVIETFNKISLGSLGIWLSIFFVCALISYNRFVIQYVLNIAYC